MCEFLEMSADFAASAPAEELFKPFGITAIALVFELQKRFS
jgi:hypothetical protein